MDKKHTPLLLLLLLFPLLLTAQPPEWAPPVRVPENTLPAGVVWATDSTIICMKTAGRQAGAIFEKYSADGRLLDHFEVLLTQFSGLEEVFAWRGKIWMLLAQYRYNARAEAQYAQVKLPDYSIPPDSMSLFLQAFDPGTMRPEGKPICLLPFHFRETVSHRAVLAFSPDSSHMACALLPDYPHERYPGMVWLLEAEGHRFWYAVANDSLRVLGRDTAVLPTRRIGEKVFVRHWAVDNRGEVAVAADVAVREGDQKPKEPNFRPTLFFLSLRQRKVQFYELPFEGFIRNLRLNFDPNNNLICSGFYSTTDYEHLRGVFLLKVDAAREKTLQRKQTPFPESLLSEFLGKVRARKGEQLELLDIYDARWQKDGGLLLVAESQQFINEAYTYSNLLFLRLKPNGDIAWSRAMRRSLVESGPSALFLSYRLLFSGGTYWVVCNKSTRIDGGAEIYALSDDGQLSLKASWKHADADQYLLCPTLSALLPDGRIVLTASKRNFKEARLGILRF